VIRLREDNMRLQTLPQLMRLAETKEKKALAARLAAILEVPLLHYLPACLVAWRVLTPMRRATGGTVLACRLALDQGLAINLGGGYHHASRDRGGGFCVYADTPLALESLQREGRIRPWPKVEEDVAVSLPPRTNGAEYLGRLRDALPAALDRYRPDLVVYNAGSDVLWSDPLSHLFLTSDELAERDLLVVTEVRQRGVPLAMVLSGGYGPASWEAHARSIEGLLARFDRAG
jgi:histone deacetylase 11